ASLDKSILSDILRGAGDKLKEANIALVGGHSIDDEEPKFGLAVTGVIHPDKIKTNAGAKPGDQLILTKPIGVGIYSSALKKGLLSDEEIEHVTKVMTTLNKTAAETADNYQVHASTDVTGFGLLVHASEKAAGTEVGLTSSRSKVPVLPRAKESAEERPITGGSKNTYNHPKAIVTYPEEISQVDRWLLCAAVTSAGLLMSVD